MRVLGLLLISLAVTRLPLSAADYYIDATLGDDVSGDGSAAQPWRSITHAVSTFGSYQSNAHLWIAAGTYDAASTGEVFPLLLVGGISLHGVGGPVVLRNQGSIIRASSVGAYTPCGWFEGLTLESTDGGTGIDIRETCRDVLIRDCTVSGFAIGIDVVSFWTREFSTQTWTPYVDVDRARLFDNDTAIRLRAAYPSTEIIYPFLDVFDSLITHNGNGIELSAPCYACGDFQVYSAFSHNTIAFNSGNAIEIHADRPNDAGANSHIVLDNNVVAFNSGHAIANLDDGTDPYLPRANDFWQNASGDFFRPVAIGPGNITADPAFADAPAGDFHLAAGSPCIDAAPNPYSFPTYPYVDIERTQRTLDGDGDLIPVADIGAYERRPASGIDLRRADLSSLDPPTPALADCYPFGAGNPLTPVLFHDFVAGDVDSRAVDDLRFPLLLYQFDSPGGSVLHLVKLRRHELPIGWTRSVQFFPR